MIRIEKMSEENITKEVTLEKTTESLDSPAIVVPK